MDIHLILTKFIFTIIIGFNKIVKVMIIVKDSCELEKRFIMDKLSRIPIIKTCIHSSCNANAFSLHIKYSNNAKQDIRFVTYDELFPLTVRNFINNVQNDNGLQYTVLVAPYVSEKSGAVCRENGIGYADLSGNIYLSTEFVYIYEKGNPNLFSKKQKVGNIFKALSSKTSSILRLLLADTEKVWKLKYLAEAADCSIGMVSKVKDVLCRQLWAEMTLDGLKIIEAKGLLDTWAKEYAEQEVKVLSCYTSDPLPLFERKIKIMSDEKNIKCCLTGLAGGTRYAPVVRYNRVHILVDKADIYDFLELSGCKMVESGANVVIIEAGKEHFIGAGDVNGDKVASPVQVFLNCSAIKGRGVEMAEAVFRKKISK